MPRCVSAKLVLASLLLGVLAPPVAQAQTDVPVVGTQTKGGLQPGTAVIHVTTLSDSGEGSLRDALAKQGPRVVVFDVAGAIKLETDLQVRNPFVTVAGATAPEPGVTLENGTVIIASHDVVLSHLRIRPGPAATAALNKVRDGIVIKSRSDGTATEDIALRNISITWSADKAISLWRPPIRRITIEDCLLAEALNDAGHPEGEHSMSLLIGRGVQLVEARGNLFAHNKWRNPVIADGASALVANNLVYNPGQQAIHFYTHTTEGGPIVASIEANAVVKGRDTKRNISPVFVPGGPVLAMPGTHIFVKDNLLYNSLADVPSGGISSPDNPPGSWQAEVPPLKPSRPITPVGEVAGDVLRFAGARPGMRDPVDQRIVRSVAEGSGSILNSMGEVGGQPPVELHMRDADAPADPEALAIWLCEQDHAVGGRAPECLE